MTQTQDVRPQALSGYIGQEDVKRNLGILVKAAKAKGQPIDHIIVHGTAGTGKTTISRIVATEMGTQMHSVLAPALNGVDSLVQILLSVKRGQVLFLDEIHRMSDRNMELLYTAMEDKYVEIVVGKVAIRTLRIELPPFTVIGATTQIAKVAEPLRARFGSAFFLDYYPSEQLADIIENAKSKYDIQTTAEGVLEIAKRSRGTPRIALKLLRRAGDYALANDTVVDQLVADNALKGLGIDQAGLDTSDRAYLSALCERFMGGPTGVNAISSVLNKEVDELEDVIEPWLLRLGMIERTPKGRIATVRGFEHLGLKSSQIKRPEFV